MAGGMLGVASTAGNIADGIAANEALTQAQMFAAAHKKGNEIAAQAI